MGAADSKLISSEGVADVIETIRAGRSGEEVDPCLERLQNLRVALLVEPSKRKPDVSHARCVNNITWPTGGFLCTVSSLNKKQHSYESFYLFFGGGQAGPTLRSPGEESSLTDILLQPKLSQSDSVNYAALDATTTAELLSLYQEWQRRNAAKVSKNQEEIGFKIDAVEAVAMKLLQRLNYSASVMKTSAAHLQDVEHLKVEVREMKRALNIVLGNYEALCKRVEMQGPEFLRGTTRPSSRASSTIGT
ncbi:hypothetical protein M758_6G033500 [Ceratodon purpureus]|nr:hypothetical protein M758_6G033500 [Ceratodon purpureus]